MSILLSVSARDTDIGGQKGQKSECMYKIQKLQHIHFDFDILNQSCQIQGNHLMMVKSLWTFCYDNQSIRVLGYPFWKIQSIKTLNCTFKKRNVLFYSYKISHILIYLFTINKFPVNIFTLSVIFQYYFIESKFPLTWIRQTVFITFLSFLLF